MFYSNNFATFRKSKGLTLEEIGKKVGVSKTAVKYWEDGTSEPKTKNIIVLAKALGCSVTDISDMHPEQELIENTENLALSDEDAAILKYYQDPRNKRARYKLLLQIEEFNNPVIQYKTNDTSEQLEAAEEPGEYGKKKSNAHVA